MTQGGRVVRELWGVVALVLVHLLLHCQVRDGGEGTGRRPEQRGGPGLGRRQGVGLARRRLGLGPGGAVFGIGVSVVVVAIIVAIIVAIMVGCRTRSHRRSPLARVLLLILPVNPPAALLGEG